MTMTLDPFYGLAFTTGFLGSGHCLGMCGGLVAAFSVSCARRKNFSFQILYNCGRILTYTFIGAIVGWLGSILAYANRFSEIMRAALLGSDIFIIVVGIGTVGMFSRLNIMKLDFPLSMKSFVQAATSLLRLPSTIAALPLGMAMGFLPCGFSYAMMITAAQSASPLRGGLSMLFFGLGTAPALLLLGGTAQWLSAGFRSWMVRCAGLAVALMGVYNLIRHLSIMGWSLSAPLQFICH